jgi:hypothetical protein
MLVDIEFTRDLEQDGKVNAQLSNYCLLTNGSSSKRVYIYYSPSLMHEYQAY